MSGLSVRMGFWGHFFPCVFFVLLCVRLGWFHKHPNTPFKKIYCMLRHTHIHIPAIFSTLFFVIEMCHCTLRCSFERFVCTLQLLILFCFLPLGFCTFSHVADIYGFPFSKEAFLLIHVVAINTFRVFVVETNLAKGVHVMHPTRFFND